MELAIKCNITGGDEMKSGNYRRFYLSVDHIKLLQKLAIIENDSSCSITPMVYPKKPYGNSDIPGDIIHILGWLKTHEKIDEQLIKKAMKVHREMSIALEIVLCTQSFIPGWYETPTSSVGWARYIKGEYYENWCCDKINNI